MVTGTVNVAKNYMEFLGWTNGGAAGSVKYDGDGRIIATQGDPHWIADVDIVWQKIDRFDVEDMIESINL
jgi:hypothetical protein